MNKFTDKKNILIVLVNPRKNSLSHAIYNNYLKWLYEADFQCETIDLYQDKFNPILTLVRDLEKSEQVKRYREMVLWAEHITFIYPIWWANMPAILKGFFDRVFVDGFSHSSIEDRAPKRLLEGRTATIIRTFGSPCFVKYLIGGDSNFSNLAKGILRVCGIKVTQKFSLHGIDALSFRKTKIEKLMQNLKKSVKKI
ncbi:MAG: NAD(P)H-dependent oxidoreductase [Candidatus Brocadiaceae bacterium]|nr:NAD(P)H-dependent oxidoreductase [Candidatus Brocadiaceae bacterium]